MPMGMKGRKLTDEQRRKLSESMKRAWARSRQQESLDPSPENGHSPVYSPEEAKDSALEGSSPDKSAT